MAGMLDQALGVYPKTLALRAQRMELLAANLANADTPNYKAKDINFKEALSRAAETNSLSLGGEHSKHIRLSTEVGSATTIYRDPVQSSLDGNTVETQIEQAAFMDNAMRYQATLTFLSGRIKGLLTAIRGE